MYRNENKNVNGVFCLKITPGKYEIAASNLLDYLGKTQQREIPTHHHRGFIVSQMLRCENVFGPF